MKSRVNVGIVGLGLIGNKRAIAIRETRLGKLIAASDTSTNAAQAFVEQHRCQLIADWRDLVKSPDIDVVIIAVPNAYLAPIALEAFRNGKHVLCEKPFGIAVAEARKMHRTAQKAGVVVKVGFNHRFHAALMKAHEIFSRGGIGDVLFMRARYGHGGREGMEKEWRFNAKISGGGELLDQGVHVIDLAGWFAGRFTRAYGRAETKFWNTTVDDNAFGILRSEKATFEFHVSTTNWKNIFSFEIFGSHGYLQIDGKGGSYGAERLIYGRRRKHFGVPIVKEYSFPAGDASWNNEWANFIQAIHGKASVCGGTTDGIYANAVVEALYGSSSSGREVRIRLDKE
ncbi:MAG TPA: Gfo/Idh/MocA family oxidoreductase [Terracidiphilus sp.]|nr:Gfo/Idh/MocA family oxidoreductase [Terracidiphilus sp.]